MGVDREIAGERLLVQRLQLVFADMMFQFIR